MSRMSSLSSQPVIFQGFFTLGSGSKSLRCEGMQCLVAEGATGVASVGPVFMVFHTSVDHSENPTGFWR